MLNQRDNGVSWFSIWPIVITHVNRHYFLCIYNGFRFFNRRAALVLYIILTK